MQVTLPLPCCQDLPADPFEPHFADVSQSGLDRSIFGTETGARSRQNAFVSGVPRLDIRHLSVGKLVARVMLFAKHAQLISHA